MKNKTCSNCIFCAGSQIWYSKTCSSIQYKCMIDKEVIFRIYTDTCPRFIYANEKHSEEQIDNWVRDVY